MLVCTGTSLEKQLSLVIVEAPLHRMVSSGNYRKGKGLAAKVGLEFSSLPTLFFQPSRHMARRQPTQQPY